VLGSFILLILKKTKEMYYKITYKQKLNGKNKTVEIESNSILAAIGLVYEMYDFVLIEKIELIKN
jgi:hypothetical protein